MITFVLELLGRVDVVTLSFECYLALLIDISDLRVVSSAFTTQVILYGLVLFGWSMLLHIGSGGHHRSL